MLSSCLPAVGTAPFVHATMASLAENLHNKSSFLHTKLSLQSISLKMNTLSILLRDNFTAFLEVLLSPVKYSLFQAAGYLVLHAAGFVNSGPSMPSTSKVGIIGGMMLAIIFSIALLAFGERQYIESQTTSMRSLLFLFGEEVLCSAVAALMGGLALGIYPSSLLIHIWFGIAGPVACLICLSVSLGIVVTGFHATRNIRAWSKHIGY